MDRNFRKGPADGSGASPASEAWLFAQAVLGKPVPSPFRAEADARARREHLEWLAQISPEDARRLRGRLSEEVDAKAQQDLLEWVAEITGVREAGWDSSLHPRVPKGQPDGGQWVATGGSGGADAKSPSSSLDGVAVSLSRPSSVRTAVPLKVSANSQADTNHDALMSPYDLTGNGARGAGQNPFRLVSASSKDHAIAQAAAKGDLTRLKDLINSGGLSAGEQKAAQAAINRLMDTAQNIISKELKGSVMRQFPRDMLNMKLKDIIDLAKGSGPLADKAKTALKLLEDNRFKK